jgi:hypothetical protein
MESITIARVASQPATSPRPEHGSSATGAWSRRGARRKRLRFALRNAWWAAVDSNHLPPRYQHGALPVELAAQNQKNSRAQTHGV